MTYEKYIHFDKLIKDGQPCLKDTETTVSETIRELIRTHFSHEDFELQAAALGFAADFVEQTFDKMYHVDIKEWAIYLQEIQDEFKRRP